MTDRKPDALTPSSRPGALTTAPTGDLVSRGLADLKALEQIVVFPAKGLEAAVREALGKPDGRLTRADLEGLEKLNARGLMIEDLTGLERCVNLTKLKLRENLINDVTPLVSLTKLTELWLPDNFEISDLTPLAALTKLDWLDLSDNQISDLTPLTALTNLTTLDLQNNPLSQQSLEVHVPTLESRGVTVILDDKDD